MQFFVLMHRIVCPCPQLLTIYKNMCVRFPTLSIYCISDLKLLLLSAVLYMEMMCSDIPGVDLNKWNQMDPEKGLFSSICTLSGWFLLILLS